MQKIDIQKVNNSLVTEALDSAVNLTSWSPNKNHATLHLKITVTFQEDRMCARVKKQKFKHKSKYVFNDELKQYKVNVMTLLRCPRDVSMCITN